MTTAAASRILRRNFPTIKAVRTGQGTLRNTVLILGGEWETREAIASAAAPFFPGQDVRVVL